MHGLGQLRIMQRAFEHRDQELVGKGPRPPGSVQVSRGPEHDFKDLTRIDLQELVKGRFE
jgi:hypothetical protein